MEMRENQAEMPGSPALTLEHITKQFPGIVAVDDVSVSFGRGEITALLGQNGAGKSTLIGVMAGLFGSDFDGEVIVGGEPFAPADVSAAERAGIVLIAQEINVIPEFTVAQMLMLNREPTRFGLVDGEMLEYEATRILQDLGVDVRATNRMGRLDLAHQQLVMIARALSANAGVLILDEPTARAHRRRIAAPVRTAPVLSGPRHQLSLHLAPACRGVFACRPNPRDEGWASRW